MRLKGLLLAILAIVLCMFALPVMTAEATNGHGGQVVVQSVVPQVVFQQAHVQPRVVLQSVPIHQQRVVVQQVVPQRQQVVVQNVPVRQQKVVVQQAVPVHQQQVVVQQAAHDPIVRQRTVIRSRPFFFGRFR